MVLGDVPKCFLVLGGHVVVTVFEVGYIASQLGEMPRQRHPAFAVVRQPVLDLPAACGAPDLEAGACASA